MAVTPGPRVISIWQPYVWAMTAGHKKIENRKKSTPYRGVVYLHAGKSYSRDAHDWMTEEMNLRVPEELPRGAIIAVATLKDVIDDDPAGIYGRWFVPGKFGLIFTRPKLLKKPVPHKGQLGLYQASSSLRRQVERQLQ